MLHLPEIGEVTPLPQPPQALHPAPWLAPAPLRLAPRIVARHANCYEAIQFGEDPAALAVPVVAQRAPDTSQPDTSAGPPSVRSSSGATASEDQRSGARGHGTAAVLS